MQVNKNILGRKQYTLPRSETARHKLAIIENPYPTCPEVLQSVQSLGDFHRYPHDDGVVTELTSRLKQYVGVGAESDIILSNGSDNALKLICEAYVTPSSRTLVPTPTYPHMQQFIGMMYNGGVDETPYSGEGVLPVDGHNLVYMCSPNIPLGYILSIETIRDMCTRHQNTMFVVDEAYYEYTCRDAVYSSELSACGLTSFLRNLIVVRTFSKAFGLAGLRIGYLVANASVVDTLRVLVNEKNVTVGALTAACACMRNLEYYRAQMLDAHATARWLVDKLGMLIPRRGIQLTRVDGDPPIYGFSMLSGYYFMLYARDPSNVVEQFARGGILVRNKNDDCPGGIRVTLGLRDQMQDVLDMITWINLSWVVRNRRVAFDLDGTLRRGCRDSDTMVDGAARVLRECRDAVVCSNNCTYTPDEIRSWLGRYECDLPVYTPLTRLRDVCRMEGHRRVFTVGNARVREWIDSNINVESSEYDAVFLACDFYVDSATMLQLCGVASRGAPVYYADESTSVSLDGCSDFRETGELRIPDIGTWIGPLRDCGYECVNIGKPLPLVGACDVVVGDSMATDGEMAQCLGAYFVYVDSDIVPGCAYEKMLYVRSVADL